MKFELRRAIQLSPTPKKHMFFGGGWGKRRKSRNHSLKDYRVNCVYTWLKPWSVQLQVDMILFVAFFKLIWLSQTNSNLKLLFAQTNTASVLVKLSHLNVIKLLGPFNQLKCIPDHFPCNKVDRSKILITWYKPEFRIRAKMHKSDFRRNCIITDQCVTICRIPLGQLTK